MRKFFVAVSLLLVVVMLVGNYLAFYQYNGVLESYFGIEGAVVENFDTNQYFEKHAPSEAAATNGAANLGRTIEAEGAVLLKNNNKALPLATGAKVSLFSASSVDMIYGSSGGSGAIGAGAKTTLKDSLEAVGYSVNPTLWSFYQSAGYHRTVGGLAQGVNYYDANKFLINEVPYDKYTEDVINSYSQYNDAAIIVIARTGAENGDLPRSLSMATNGANTGSLLELDANERKMVEEVTKNFDKVIVLLNTSNPMECGFLDEYDIDSCLWIGGLGLYGLTSVADIITGVVNPSGRLVDTYAYDVFSAPAMQNMGNYEYWTNNGTKETEHHYYAYSEGIYVGYKYYETRYEDKVLGRGNAGDFNYGEQVQFPFGYGISYTNFEWSDFKAVKKGDEIEVSVKVTNVGEMRGKEVVQIYYQSPYTAYDVQNGVEKAAVNLVTFDKTGILQPGESTVVTLDFNIEEMKSYDANGKKTYYLEGSSEVDKYFVTAAKNSHEAINNILEAKGYSVGGNKNMAEGNIKIDEKLYNVDSHSGNAVGNLFDEADGTQYHSDLKYLSRSDWSQMDNNGLLYGVPTGNNDMDGPEYKAVLSDELKKILETEGFAAAGAPEENFTMPKYGVKGDKTLISMKGKDFDDPEWDALLDQIPLEDMIQIVCKSGYKTYAIEEIGKPYQTDADGPQAWVSFIGDGLSSGGLPYAIVIASTWDADLAEQVGYLMGELCLWSKQTNSSASNLTGWYAPAMNIHRTPFGGRNFEYYSEDGMLSGIIGSRIVKGATGRGVMCYIKHFAVNEQDRNRMTVNATWIQEQALREIYLKPFEMSIKDGNSLAVMTSYNRIGTVWAGGDYRLITGVLRNEWGFNGFVLTDYMDGDWENVDQMLAAGGDGALNTATHNSHATVTCTTEGAQAITYMRRAMHHLLYASVNSNAMNGIDGATKITGGTPIFHRYMQYVNIGLGSLLALSVLMIFVKRKDS
jgi:beta-glucosidase